MIKIKNLTVRNFMSVGNATQAINFDRDDLTLVLGENLDLGSNGARNGTGKTTIINALSYALYGTALTNIRRNNLINKTNQKNMLVSIDFSVDNITYRIERGRAPNVLRFFVDDDEQLDDDEARGEMRDTQKEINGILNMGHEMFKHTVALNTYTTPFLSLRANDQKHIIEELLGITLLTQKADKLKELNKTSKNNITEEEFRNSAILKANKHIEDQIKALKRRQTMWLNKKASNVNKLATDIGKLMDLDIDSEIQIHKDLIVYKKHKKEIDVCNKWIGQITRTTKQLNRTLISLETDLSKIANHECHACGQEIHDEKQEENKLNKEKLISDTALQLLGLAEQEDEHKLKLSEIGDIGDRPKTFYDSADEAHAHRSTLETLTAQLTIADADEDPYAEQIVDMEETAIQDVSYDELNRLVNLQEHQAFLLKLLTSKDSFIRRKIIEQNLIYLNNRLTHYLNEINLPHQIKFLSDLSVEITELGRDLDFDNLSRGERTRLILSLSWAFRDVYESMFSHINLMFVDELIDSGLDADGVESSVKILKSMARERNKSVWLVSHREELISRVHNTMKVIKENGFTSFDTED